MVENCIKIEDLHEGKTNYSIKVKLMAKIKEKEIRTRQGPVDVADYLIADDTNCVIFQAWDRFEIKMMDKLVGHTIKITDGYVSSYQGELRVQKGNIGDVDPVDEDIPTVDIDDDYLDDLMREPPVEYQIVEDLAPGNGVNVKVKILKKKYWMAKSNGKPVARLRVADETGEITLMLFEKDADFGELGDVVELRSAYVKSDQNGFTLFKGRDEYGGKIFKIDEEINVE